LLRYRELAVQLSTASSPSALQMGESSALNRFRIEFDMAIYCVIGVSRYN
jgi:hypothetical protein